MDAAGTGKQMIAGKPAMKPFWEIIAKGAGVPGRHQLAAHGLGLLPGWRLLVGLPYRGRHAHRCLYASAQPPMHPEIPNFL